jgi:hypothetical protein
VHGFIDLLARRIVEHRRGFEPDIGSQAGPALGIDRA